MRQWRAGLEISRHHKAGIPGEEMDFIDPKVRVAIIGGGASGLASLRYCLAAGLNATLFEKEEVIGGVWRDIAPKTADKIVGHATTPKGKKTGAQAADSDSDGGRPGRPGSSAMYDGLITNLPKEIMAFFDLPFKPHLPSFVTNKDMGSYLHQYAYYHGLMDHIKCSKRVVRMWPNNDEKTSEGEEQEFQNVPWMVEVSDESCAVYNTTHRFDAVIVANGHYNAPVFPNLQGLDVFPGVVMHSIEFDKGDDFRGKNVVLLGAKASGTDIALQLKLVAKSVTVCDKNVPDNVSERPDRDPLVAWRPAIKSLLHSGGVELVDGNVLQDVDAVIFCTGYKYDFPFIDQDFVEKNDLIHSSGRCVQHLHMDCFLKSCPSLSFVGLPYSVVPFPLCELQARWIAAVYGGLCEYPVPMEAKEEVPVSQDGINHFHLLGSHQWEYGLELLNLVDDEAYRQCAATEHPSESSEDGARGLDSFVAASTPSFREVPLASHIKRQMRVNQEIYEDVSGKRPKWVGGNAAYRSIEYRIDDLETCSWRVLTEEETENFVRNQEKKGAEYLSASNAKKEEKTFVKKKKNLYRKMKNIESQLPTVPTIQQWEECLSGITRCTMWWRELIGAMESDEERIKYSLVLWMLVQHALQSGPLVNSKPGYFKRSNKEIIEKSLLFLKEVQGAGDLGFTDPQKERFKKWVKNAEKAFSKAADSGKVPVNKSAFSSKKQRKGKKKHS